MADRIKKIKIKQTDGSFSDYIPIGADAKNIDFEHSGSSVESKLKKTPYYYNNVATMKLDDSLKVGDMAITLGYYEANDGGGAEYVIIDDSSLEDDGGSIHELTTGLKAQLIISNLTINIKQLGFKADLQTQDCSKAAIIYSNMMKRDQLLYVLFLPSGKWYFSETDWYYSSTNPGARYGVRLKGNFIYGGLGPQIMPFKDNQKYIWNIGTTYESGTIVGNNDIEGFSFSSGSQNFCETALLLTACCYSHFDNLCFSSCRGSAITVQTGFENYFGRLDFRGVGYVTKDFTYPGLYYKANPTYSPGSAVSANYIEYINMEGLAGSGIYYEYGCNANHNEINNLQVEWTFADSDPKHYDSSMTLTTLSPNSQKTIPWDKDDDNIDHLYIIQGNCGANYDPLIVNNITTSWSSPIVYKFTYQDSDNLDHVKYLRRSGIVGELETRNAHNYGMNIMVNNIHSRGDDNGLPAFHSISLKSGSQVMISKMNKGLVPFQTAGNFELLTLGERYLTNRIDDQNTPSFDRQNFIPVTDLRFQSLTGKNIVYDKDSWNEEFKLCGKASTTSALFIKLDGRKKISLRFKIIDYTEDTFPTSVYMNCYTYFKDGTRENYHIEHYKTDLANNKFPLNEFFIEDISKYFPYDDCVFSYLLGGNHIKFDGICISDNDKTATASQLNSKYYKKSAVGATAFCTDKRRKPEDDLGVMVIFDGTNWKTLDNIALSNLVD